MFRRKLNHIVLADNGVQRDVFLCGKKNVHRDAKPNPKNPVCYQCVEKTVHQANWNGMFVNRANYTYSAYTPSGGNVNPTWGA